MKWFAYVVQKSGWGASQFVLIPSGTGCVPFRSAARMRWIQEAQIKFPWKKQSVHPKNVSFQKLEEMKADQNQNLSGPDPVLQVSVEPAGGTVEEPNVLQKDLFTKRLMQNQTGSGTRMFWFWWCLVDHQRSVRQKNIFIHFVSKLPGFLLQLQKSGRMRVWPGSPLCCGCENYSWWPGLIGSWPGLIGNGFPHQCFEVSVRVEETRKIWGSMLLSW